ncbi:hypothetical protein B6S12_03925 [Helicobacter valdiviensis]|uniref:Uncharacterized protein n=1 Tax=Helicobacter valdiviensis TaxID=1458358 RepID=A0A2W6MVF3_9HELI|nr:hypothetical protein [Helicobacter valdiviensis]PZT48485.1 hypothetical protein B6S12_03925 [Helicobacter valdiviensis]
MQQNELPKLSELLEEPAFVKQIQNTLLLAQDIYQTFLFLKGKYDTQTQENENLTKEFKEILLTCKNLEESITKKEKDIAYKQEAIKKTYEESISILEDLDSKIEQELSSQQLLKKDLENIKDEILTYKEEVSFLLNSLKEYEENIKALRALMDENKTLKEDLQEELIQKAKELRENLLNLQNEFKEALEIHKFVSRDEFLKIQELIPNKPVLENPKRDELEEEITQSNSTLKQLEESIKNLQEEQSSLKAKEELEELKKVFEALEDKESEEALNLKIQIAQKELEALEEQRRLDEIQKELEALQEQKTQLQTHLDSKNEELQKIYDEDNKTTLTPTSPKDLTTKFYVDSQDELLKALISEILHDAVFKDGEQEIQGIKRFSTLYAQELFTKNNQLGNENIFNASSHTFIGKVNLENADFSKGVNFLEVANFKKPPKFEGTITFPNIITTAHTKTTTLEALSTATLRAALNAYGINQFFNDSYFKKNANFAINPTCNTNPTADTHLARKLYVDYKGGHRSLGNQTAPKIDFRQSVNFHINMTGRGSIGVAHWGGLGKSGVIAVDNSQNIVSFLAPFYFRIAPGSMSGRSFFAYYCYATSQILLARI